MTKAHVLLTLNVRAYGVIVDNLVVPEKQRNTPHRRESDEDVDDSADNTGLAAEDKRNKVKAKDSD